MTRRAWCRATASIPWAVAVALLLPAAAPLPGGQTPTARSATAAPAKSLQGPTAPVPRLILNAQSQFVAAQDPLLLSIRVEGAPPGGDVRVSALPRVASRATFHDVLSLGISQPRGELFNLDPMPVATLPTSPDGSKQLNLAFGGRGESGGGFVRRPGVYPVQVRLRDTDHKTVAQLTSHLIRLPPADEPTDRLQVALLLDLHARPVVQPDGSSRILAKDLGGIRSVTAELGSHPGLAASILPTPQTVDALASSTTDTDAALLADTRSVIRRPGRQILASTYVRVDAGAWIADGLGDELRHQQALGTSVLANVVGPVDDRTWVAGDGLTPDALNELQQRGVTQLVVPEAALTPLDSSSAIDTLTEPFKVSGAGGLVPAVAIDEDLEQAFTRTSDPVLGAHQLLAELAVASFAQEGSPRGLVVSPPDDWVPSQAFLATLFDGLQADNPLVEGVTVDQLFARVPAARTRRSRNRSLDLVRRLGASAVPSLGTFPDRLRAARALLASYGSMVGRGSARTQRFEDRLVVAGSADLSRRRQAATVDAVSADLNHELGGVTTPTRERVTLAAREADFPLSLQKRLPYPVDVVVELDASNRLTFPGGNRIAVRLLGERTRVKLRVRAPVSGDTPLRVTVRSPDGRAVLATSRYTVRSTAVSGVGLVLTAGAALFLVVWWGRHVRSARRRRRNPPGVG